MPIAKTATIDAFLPVIVHKSLEAGLADRDVGFAEGEAMAQAAHH
jgi:hypothetical protein